ncbi:MAG: DNA translocase FtsK, partial [Lachnospiraceae bacterium]|nr:DNA translocase FtsK [Lachnospiraceae bacterium]
KGINCHSIFSKLGDGEPVVQTELVDELLAMEDNVISQEVGSAVEAGQAGAAVRQVVSPALQVSRETVARSLPETDELHELRPKSSYHAQERISFGAAEPARNQTAYRVTRENEAPKRESAYRASVHIEKEEQSFIEPEEGVDFREAEPVELKPVREEQNPRAVESRQDLRAQAKPKDKQVPVNQMSIDMAKLYQFPPISLLQKGKSSNARDGQKHLEETARRLQECLHTFGVNVTITDISQGPAVTRYELQPEQGVKVSRIVNLSDDIKLNLAATDIRIEAPIPGKSAIGIEVPNKENSAVAFRELIESQEFQSFQSKISFAVGKDIAGKIVVTDIAKMPHMLIAGSTGSGKSVCINTLIMSILYKAHPDEVKMIMIDPKVVELSSYNGIPHLLIPVVTDPKQAAGALQWGVSEMMSRYEKFAEFNVRDMKGFNAKIDEKAAKGEVNLPKKLPQIVIIVDELADLMMVAPGEVEEAICRLAQLARAAGIHLIIATQRPSVDVITGLIKANMPSRVAFAVSSGVDSRTILDMNGAEKLLGKGDMLFYPQGYSKPVRVQGSFVSDAEVGAVVDFLKNQQLGNVYHEDQEEIQSQINNLKSGAGNAGSSTNGRSDDKDALFADAGRFIIEKDKASIGMLQRVFKIGFNRAARIVDQLCEYGVVGDEEGTKPRKVLMSLEQFEALLEEI